MIIDNVGLNGTHTLPAYLGATRTDDEILGVGSDSVIIIDASLEMITYFQALRSGSVSVAAASAHPRRGQSLHYSELLRQLAGLAECPETDELGRLRPSSPAIDTASKLAFRILTTGADVTVPADVSVDRDGDVRIL